MTRSLINRYPRQVVVLGCFFSFATGLVSAQVNVTVDLSKPINVLTESAIGYPMPMYDGPSFSAGGAPYLKTAGVTTPRYPGNHGVADLYHWSTASLTKYKASGDAVYLAPESNMANFAQTAEKMGGALIVVNYGSNVDGTGGGEPAEAAAWVAYANGDPADTRAIGKDSTGHDWQTIGYWATLRGDAPFAGDDGLNALRAHHPKPFGFKLWQVGDQLYNNGFFGGEHVGNPDLHGPVPTGPKDFARLKKDPRLSPDAIATNYKAFVAAMKAVDPSIQIGVALTTPPAGEQFASGWNHAVLKGACSHIDFVSLDWQTGGLVAPDYKTLDESTLFHNSRAELATIIRAMLDEDKSACPAGDTPKIAMSVASPLAWPKLEHPVVRALWVADLYAILEESGFMNEDWTEGYGDTMMSADLKKFGPAFYGLQMLHIVAHSPGDALLDARSSSEMVSVHATRRRDGIVGLMLVNTDPRASATVKLSLKGGTVGAAGKRFDYGAAQLALAAGPAASALTVSGTDFTVTVPAYSVVDILLPLAK